MVEAGLTILSINARCTDGSEAATERLRPKTMDHREDQDRAADDSSPHCIRRLRRQRRREGKPFRQGARRPQTESVDVTKQIDGVTGSRISCRSSRPSVRKRSRLWTASSSATPKPAAHRPRTSRERIRAVLRSEMLRRGTIANGSVKRVVRLKDKRASLTGVDLLNANPGPRGLQLVEELLV
jgi:hypothetical protein